MSEPATFKDWYALERYAQAASGSTEFMALFPSGPRKCRFLDAYMGLVSIDGIDGFLMTRDLDNEYPGTPCVVLEKEPE